VSEQYNDNVYFDDRDIWDFVTLIGYGLSLDYSQPRFHGSVAAGNSAQVYARQTGEDSAAGSQSGTASVQYQPWERLILDATDSLSWVRRTRTGSNSASGQATPPDQPPPDLPPPGPDVQASTLLARGDAFSNYFASSLSYIVRPRWTLGLNYGHSVSNFNDPGARDLTNRTGASLGYAWRPTTAVSTYFSYSRFDFKDQDVPDTESFGGGVGVSEQFYPTLSLSASAGFFTNSPRDSNGSGGVADSSGPTWSVGLTKGFERASLNAGASQSITASGGVGGTSETRSAFLGYSQQLRERLSGSLSTSYGHFDASGPNYQFVVVSAGLSTSFWRYFTAGLRYNYRWRDASQSTESLSQGSVDGNIVSVYVSTAYPLWRGEL